MQEQIEKFLSENNNATLTEIMAEFLLSFTELTEILAKLFTQGRIKTKGDKVILMSHPEDKGEDKTNAALDEEEIDPMEKKRRAYEMLEKYVKYMESSFHDKEDPHFEEGVPVPDEAYYNFERVEKRDTKVDDDNDDAFDDDDFHDDAFDDDEDIDFNDHGGTSDDYDEVGDDDPVEEIYGDADLMELIRSQGPKEERENRLIALLSKKSYAAERAGRVWKDNLMITSAIVMAMPDCTRSDVMEICHKLINGARPYLKVVFDFVLKSLEETDDENFDFFKQIVLDEMKKRE